MGALKNSGWGTKTRVSYINFSMIYGLAQFHLNGSGKLKWNGSATLLPRIRLKYSEGNENLTILNFSKSRILWILKGNVSLKKKAEKTYSGAFSGKAFNPGIVHLVCSYDVSTLAPYKARSIFNRSVYALSAINLYSLSNLCGLKVI